MRPGRQVLTRREYAVILGLIAFGSVEVFGAVVESSWLMAVTAGLSYLLALLLPFVLVSLARPNPRPTAADTDRQEESK